MADSPFIYDIDESNYEQIVIQGSHQVPVLVDFWASWCQPCQMLMPLLARLVEEFQGRFILAKIDTEAQQAIAAQFGIRSIPTVKLFKDGQAVDEFAGALPEGEIRAFLDRHLPRPSDNIVVQAQERLLAGDAAGAIELLQQALAADPSNPRITVAIAQAQAAGGDFDAAESALDSLTIEQQAEPDVQRLRGRLFFDRIAASGETAESLAQRLQDSADDSDARYHLAAHRIMQGDLDQAAEDLLLLMRKDRGYGDDAARDALLKLFDLLGDDPAATRYRARMFNLLH
jgi:putative thioredoxin